jgi:hypothetical protein
LNDEGLGASETGWHSGALPALVSQPM